MAIRAPLLFDKYAKPFRGPKEWIQHDLGEGCQLGGAVPSIRAMKVDGLPLLYLVRDKRRTGQDDTNMPQPASFL